MARDASWLVEWERTVCILGRVGGEDGSPEGMAWVERRKKIVDDMILDGGKVVREVMVRAL